MSDKHEQYPPPPDYDQPPVNRAHEQPYEPPQTSYGPASQAPVYQQPQYQRPPMNNVYLSPCAQGRHNSSMRFGLVGILCAIFCFPIGFICMCMDTERVCSRCGIRM